MPIDTEQIIKSAIDFAYSFVGQKETPKDSNRGAVIDAIQKEFGMVGQQYCVMFTLYCYIKSLKLHNVKPDKIPRIASSQSLFEYAKKNDSLVPDEKFIRKGDIIIFRHDMKPSGHAGLIIGPMRLTPEGSKYCNTIEGNTSPSDKGSQSAGGGIYLKSRNLNESDFKVDDWWIRGFIDMEKLLEKLYANPVIV